MDPIQKKSLLARFWIPILAVIAIIGVVAPGMRAAHEDRTDHAQVGNAISAGQGAQFAVYEYFQEKNAFPKDLAEAGFVHRPDKLVRQIVLDQKSGVISMTLGFSPYEGQTILFVPSVKSDKSIVWRCTTKEVAEGALRSQCR